MKIDHFVLRLLEWLLSDDRGNSSEAMLAAYLGRPDLSDGSVPVDAADVGRCLRLCKAFPELSDRMLEAAAHCWPRWRRISAYWDVLSSMFDEGRYEEIYEWLREDDDEDA